MVVDDDRPHLRRLRTVQGDAEMIDTGCSVSEAITQTLDDQHNDNHRMDVKLTVIKAAIS